MNIRVLPKNLETAIKAAEKDKDLLSRFPPLLIAALLSVRKDDVRTGAKVDAADLARSLAKVY